MTKTVSTAELSAERARRAIADAKHEPVLVREEGRPVVWIVSADALAQAAAARGVQPDVYQQALELLAVDLYRQATLTLAQGAAMIGMHLSDFIDLCSQLDVPILWEPPGGLDAEVKAAEAILKLMNGGT